MYLISIKAELHLILQIFLRFKLPWINKSFPHSSAKYVCYTIFKERLAQFMKESDRITLHNILLHKEHFDQKLIDINKALSVEVIALSSLNAKLSVSNQSYKYKTSSMKLKIKDLESQKYALKKKHQEAENEKDEVLEYLKKIQKEIDELKKENEWQHKEIKRQEKDINKQKDIIDKLKYMNSTTSNLPPSMDILSRTRAKAQANTRTKTSRTRGGQKHHPVHKSRLVGTADHIVTVKVKKAPMGAIPVNNEKGIVEYYATQEVDIVLKKTITETRYYIDDTGKELEPNILNRYAINPLVYSADIKAATVYLNQKGTIPLQRLCDMIYEISKGSIQLRPSTISKWCQECHKKSQKKKEEIQKDIMAEPLIYVDETGIKINGEQRWIHVMTNDKGSLFLITKSRGDKENGTIRYLREYTGILMHDHFSTYQTLNLCTHAECNAHIDRYLKSGIEFDHDKDCKELLELMHEMLHRKKELILEGEYNMPEEEIKNFEKRYVETLEEGLKNYTAKYSDMEKKYVPDFVSTFRRMLADKEDYLRFIKNFAVPYTNNNAEKQCRAVKAKKKSSGQFVSELGGETYVSILSLLQTAKLKNINALETLQQVFL